MLAIISDIHGNLPALEAVLARLDAQGVQDILFLGDAATRGPYPAEVILRLKALHCPVILGNTDAWLQNPTTIQPEKHEDSLIVDIAHWCAAQIQGEAAAYLRTFQSVYETALTPKHLLLAYHGSPRFHSDTIFPDTPEEKLEILLAGPFHHIYAGGHIHRPFMRPYQGSLIINPGSVGMANILDPLTKKTIYQPYAEYALIDVTRNDISIGFHRAPYDVSQVIQAAHQRGMPHADWWTEGWTDGHNL